MNVRNVCVIGAGASGLAAARNVVAAGFEVDILENERELGGIWDSNLPVGRMYRSTHMISSKPFTQYPDYPMPDHYPDFPHHTQVLEYLRGYADHFNLREHISFGSRVERVVRADDGWSVHIRGEDRRYDVVVIASGHTWSPRLPELEGSFSGETMHSAFYRTPDVFFGKRALVVGGGNSGCDIAVEAVTTADTVFHSTRRAYHYIPKYVFGRPSDQVGDVMLKLGLPLRLRRAITSAVLRLTLGSYRDNRLPKPDHKLFETHPIVNTLLPYHIRHGRIIQKPDITRLDGRNVEFADGTSEEVDLIIYATGYNITFPFIDRSYLNWRNDRPELYLNVFHPEFDDLFAVGMIQPDSGLFKLLHWQATAIAEYLKALRDGRPAANWLKARKRDPEFNSRRAIAYRDSLRHRLEVEHWEYLKELQTVVGRLRGKSGRVSLAARFLGR